MSAIEIPALAGSAGDPVSATTPVSHCTSASYALRPAHGPSSPYPVRSHTISRGYRSPSGSAASPSRAAAPGPRFWMNTSAPASRRCSTSPAAGCLRSSVSDSLDRLSHTKWLDWPSTVRSYPRAKSPSPGRSTLITRAPRSASCRVQNGAATACSSATTVMPSNGPMRPSCRYGTDTAGRDRVASVRMSTIRAVAAALRPAGGGVLGLLVSALLAQSLVGPGVAAILGWLVHRLTTGGDLVHAAVGPLAAFGGLLLLGYLAEAAVTPLELRARARIDGAHRSDLMRLAMGTPTIDVLDDPATQALLREVRADPRNHVEYTPADGGLSALHVLVGLVAAAGAAVVLATYAWWMVPLLLVPALLVSYLENRRVLAVVGTLRYAYQEEAYADVWRQAAISPSAGKDIRVFGFAHWMVDRMQHHVAVGNAPLWNLRRRFLGTGWTTFALMSVGLVPAYAAVTLSASRGQATVATQTAVFAAGWAIFLALADLDHVQRIVGAGAMLRSYAALRQRLDATAVRPELSIVDNPPLVRFERVSFTYPHRTDPVLHRLDLEIRPGELLAIVGLNGAGKSTLIKLLAGLCAPTAGRITADGVDIADLDPAAWRRRLSIVFQDFVRYPLSAEANIRLGRAGDPDALERAVAEAGAGPTLDRLPAGLATPLSRGRTGGVDLSGGQWQQIVLARALYAVQTGAGLLVLDEPTAHLDVRTEFEVFDRLVRRRGEAGIVLISHRLSTVRRADRIVLLDGGRITESGTHDELVALGGAYARMFDIQAERFRRGFDDRIEEVAS